jgi:hypothetical protein
MKKHSAFLPALAAAALTALTFIGAPSALAAGSDDPRMAFPIHLDHTSPANGGFWNGPGIGLTWRSSVPGLQFCVAYATTHGVSFVGAGGGRSYQGDREHCLVAGRDGTVSDRLTLTEDPKQDGLLIANVVLIDNEVRTEIIPVHPLLSKAH